MAISSTTARVSYNGDGATTEFNTGFKFLANAHVQVVLRDTDGVETTWTEGTHYTLTGAGETQGTVTVDTSPTDYTPQTGEKLAILRIAPNKQESTLPLGGAFPSTTVEQALDLAAMRDQQLSERLDRTLFFPATDPVGIGAGLPIDTDRAGKFLAFDANGAPVVTAGTADATPHNAFMIELHVAASASAARATLGVVNPTAGSGIDVTAGEVSLDIDGLTEDTSPEFAADFVAIRDNSGSDNNKVRLDKLFVNKPCFSANKDATDQTGISASTFTKVTFTTEEFDVGSYYDAANSKFLPLVAGKYRITLSITYSGGVVDQSQGIASIYKNGTEHKSAVHRFSGTATHTIQVTAVVDFNGSTDYVEAYVFADGSGNKTVQGNDAYSFFCGELI